ncbi:MAG: polysaccharide deacetylase family protein [Bacillota bacterium]
MIALGGLVAILALARYGAGFDDYRAVTGHLKPVEHVTVRDKAVAITFDVSWGESVPLEVLDILRKREVKATFFVSGPWASSHPQAVKRMKAEGHEVGSHGYRHIRLSRYSRDVIVEELLKAHNILHETLGEEPRLFRPPGGDHNDAVISAALELGYITVLWSLDSNDLRRPGADTIASRVLRRSKPGEIILFHASDSAPDTPQALPRVIEGFQDAKTEMLTVSHLLDREEAP